MKIKDLIKKLQEYDEEMEVVIYDWEDRTYDNAFEFSKEIRAYKKDNEGNINGIDIFKDMKKAKAKTEGIEGVEYSDILVIYADY